jgi:hypothetical protein
MDTIEEIIDIANLYGSYWFSPDTLAFFGSSVSEEMYPMADGSGTLFISTEDNYDRSQQLHTVRHARLDEDGFTIDRATGFGAFEDLDAAHEAARLHAASACLRPPLAAA